MAITEIEAGDDEVAEPDVAERLSQEPPEEVAAETVKSSDPLPEFVTCTC